MTGSVLAAQVSAELYNPTALTGKDCAGNPVSIAVGMASVPLACYSYDSANRLTSVKDPRTGLATGYSYGSDNELTAVTAPGQSPVTLAYTRLQGRLKLTAVTRPQAAPLSGTANLTRIAYQVPLSGPGLADLTSTSDWGQAQPPSYAAAVFGPDYTGTLTQADESDPTSRAGASDWSFADLSYTTAEGYTVNTASYGAGAWQRTATDYDAQGNVVRELDAGAIDAITTSGPNPGVSDLYATKTVYNPDITDSTGAVVTPAGTLVSDTYGPVRNAVLADGSIVAARPHTKTTYDQGAPNQVNAVATNPATGAPWRLPTSAVTTAADGAGVDIAGQTITTTSTDYSVQVPGTADGWALGSPTKVTTGAVATVTGYDSAGRIVQTRQPMATGSDAGTTRTVYYTADDSAADPRCDDKPEWAGLACTTGPAAAPAAAGTPANGPASLPTTLTSAYSIWLAPTSTVETSGTATRTTTTSTDLAGRVTSSQTSAAIPGSTARPAVYTHYDPATGQVDYTGPVDRSASQGASIPDAEKTAIYDAWGRPTTYRAENPTGGYDTTTTSYDTAGRVATVSDPKGTTTTTWDGTDALGNTERRGLATKIAVTRAGPGGGTGTVDFTGAYDGDGALTVQQLPGGLTQTTSYDQGGEPLALAYAGQVTPLTARLDANGDPVLDANGDPVYDTGTPTQGTWLAWSQDNDITGRVRTDYTPAGSSFDPATSGATSLDQVVAPTGNAIGYDRAYTYDPAGRLTTVTDRTATTTGTTLAPGTPATSSAPCTVRTYTFDNNGRRTQLVADQHPDGDCTSTPTTTTTTGYAYDSADRPTTSAATNGAAPTGTYTYDAFGRQTLIPAADTPTPTDGDITLGYYDDDLAATITQGDTTTSFTLDSGGRRATATTTSSSGTTTTMQRHYSDGSDNPAWTVSTDPTGTASTTRYAQSLGGDLAASIGPDGTATLPIATLRGDVVATVLIPSTDPATTITGWADYTEYGTPRNPTATSDVAGQAGYGWLGAKQRSTTTQTAGLTLMGARLYNPTTGRFTSPDPVPGGSAWTYGYPNDPINQYDLDGRRGWLKKALRLAARHRGLLATVAATAGCAVPGVGWASCAALQAGAFAVRAQQRASGGGGFRKTWRATARDALWTGATFGVGRAVSMVKVGRLGRWRAPRIRTEYWASQSRGSRLFLEAHFKAPAAVNIYASFYASRKRLVY